MDVEDDRRRMAKEFFPVVFVVRVRRKVRQGRNGRCNFKTWKARTEQGDGAQLIRWIISRHPVAQQMVDLLRHHSPFNWSSSPARSTRSHVILRLHYLP